MDKMNIIDVLLIVAVTMLIIGLIYLPFFLYLTNYLGNQ